jgi:3',5'-cyclic AMP phosphodiesterase CpdA
MATRLLHVSDLHVGTREDSAVAAPLLAFVERQEPELVIASGDLTHRSKSDQHAEAARLLRSLGAALFVVPGNHDIPRAPVARLVRTYQRFEREWGTTEPVHTSAAVHVVGLNSVRPWPSQAGAVSGKQLERTAAALREGPAGALRVVVLHHHLVGAPWRSWKLPVVRRNRVLGTLVEAGAELIVAGHVHQAAVSERRDFEVARGGERGVVVSTAPGLGQPRPRRRGEARGLHVYQVDELELGVATYAWQEREWALTAVRRFARGRRPLKALAGV